MCGQKAASQFLSGLAGYALAIAICAPASAHYLAAQDTEKVLFSFSNGAATGGISPNSQLVADSCGNLYGSTTTGGDLTACDGSGCGVVFELSPPAGGSGPWTETVIYTFTSETDGSQPVEGMVFDAVGNLYGMTFFGGDTACGVPSGGGCGTIFELSPPAGGSGPWTKTTLYAFKGGADGASPLSSLAFDASGNLYGATEAGGNFVTNASGCGLDTPGCGVIFELSPPASAGGAWTESVPYAFCSQQGSDLCLDGQDSSGVIFDAQGNIYGGTESGGTKNAGTVYKLTPPAGGSGPWTLTTLHNFCSSADCADGNNVQSRLLIDSQGDLYGVTFSGGDPTCAEGGCGVGFQLIPPGSGEGAWSEKVLHIFEATDGIAPLSDIAFDSEGNIYGTTLGGGDTSDCLTTGPGCGTLFELSPPVGGSGTWPFTVLHTFTGGGDGAVGNPGGALYLDSRNNVYGSAYAGGNSNCGGGCGVVYQLVPPSAGLATGLSASRLVRKTAHAAATCALDGTSTALSSSVNPSSAGQSVTFTATVSGGELPTGTVGFASNGAAISGCSSVALSSSQTATCITSTLPLGGDAIIATYSGDSRNAGSSGALTQVVNSATGTATTTAVTSSQNPSAAAQAVTLTATVNPAGPPAPTGTVGFAANGTVIIGCAAVTLSPSRTAACTTSTLAVGTDAIVATYSGDTRYAGSIGALTQLVNPIPAGVEFVPVTPCRVVDTRNADGPFGGPEITANTFRSFAIPAGPCAGIPSTATAYSLNVTVVPPGLLWFVTIWPTGEGMPLASTLNSLDGRIKANAAIVPAGTSGAVSVYAYNTTHVVLDINGYFEPSSSPTLEFYPLTPCRVADTRKADGPLGGPALVAAEERDFPILSSNCGIPGAAQAYSLNFTVVPPATGDALDYLTVWPQGETQPVVSTLNNFTGTIVANAAIVPAGTNGGVAVFPSNATNLVIDVNGYFAAPGTGGLSLYTLTPCRVLDTRRTTGKFTGELTVNVVGSACTPPSTAQVFVLNATVVPSGALGYLTLWPDGETQPGVSTLNAEDGVITSNMAIVPNVNGETDAYANGTTQLVIDIFGYFAP